MPGGSSAVKGLLMSVDKSGILIVGLSLAIRVGHMAMYCPIFASQKITHAFGFYDTETKSFGI